MYVSDLFYCLETFSYLYLRTDNFLAIVSSIASSIFAYKIYLISDNQNRFTY